MRMISANRKYQENIITNSTSGHYLLKKALTVQVRATANARSVTNGCLGPQQKVEMIKVCHEFVQNNFDLVYKRLTSL